MNHKDLDRLVTRTEMNPISKRALRDVRRAVMSGEASDPKVGRSHWSIAIDSAKGQQVRMTFTLKIDKKD